MGVVLFELMCGRKAFEENKLLVPLAKFHYENGTLKDIIHPDLWNQVDPDLLNDFSEIAYSCLEDEPALRPDAEQVLEQISSQQSYHSINNEKDKKDGEDKEDLLLMLNKSSSNRWKISQRLSNIRIRRGGR